MALISLPSCTIEREKFYPGPGLETRDIYFIIRIQSEPELLLQKDMVDIGC